MESFIRFGWCVAGLALVTGLILPAIGLGGLLYAATR
jgi:hypothetical protein